LEEDLGGVTPYLHLREGLKELSINRKQILSVGQVLVISFSSAETGKKRAKESSEALYRCDSNIWLSALL